MSLGWVAGGGRDEVVMAALALHRYERGFQDGAQGWDPYIRSHSTWFQPLINLGKETLF